MSPASPRELSERDDRALAEILRLCAVGAGLVQRGHEWYVGDDDNVPGLAAESLLIKIGENVARLSPRLIDAYPDVPWSLIKRMRDRLAHRYEATDYAIVWATLVSDLPEIDAHVRRVLGIV